MYDVVGDLLTNISLESFEITCHLSHEQVQWLSVKSDTNPINLEILGIMQKSDCLYYVVWTSLKPLPYTVSDIALAVL
jgi:hypothetical protein